MRLSRALPAIGLTLATTVSTLALAPSAGAAPIQVQAANSASASGTDSVRARALTGGATRTTVAAPAKRAPKKKADKKVTPIKQSSGSRWAGQTLGTYQGPQDQAWVALNKTGVKAKNRKWVEKLVNIPKVGWTGKWTPDSKIYESTKNYIRDSQNGDPTKVVALASFRLDPWYTRARTGNPSAAQVASYKRWATQQAKAIGSTPTIVVLQPDMPFLMTARHRAKYQRMLKFAAAQYGKLPNTRVYLEAGSWDWPAPGQGGAKAAAKFLEPIGIKNVDGFAFGSTHYTDVRKEIARSKELIDIFRKKGYRNELRSVITTASNGNPWDFGDWQFPRRGVADEAQACTSKKQLGKVTCVTTGIPPTFDVTNPKWRLGKTATARANKYVDAYLWFSRPWLRMQNAPFLEDKAAQMLKVSPFREHYTH